LEQIKGLVQQPEARGLINFAQGFPASLKLQLASQRS